MIEKGDHEQNDKVEEEFVLKRNSRERDVVIDDVVVDGGFECIVEWLDSEPSDDEMDGHPKDFVNLSSSAEVDLDPLELKPNVSDDEEGEVQSDDENRAANLRLHCGCPANEQLDERHAKLREYTIRKRCLKSKLSKYVRYLKRTNLKCELRERLIRDQEIVVAEYRKTWIICLELIYRTHRLDDFYVVQKSAKHDESSDSDNRSSLKKLLKRHRLSRAKWIHKYRKRNGYQVELSVFEKRKLGLLVDAKEDEEPPAKKEKLSLKPKPIRPKPKISINIKLNKNKTQDEEIASKTPVVAKQSRSKGNQSIAIGPIADTAPPPVAAARRKAKSSKSVVPLQQTPAPNSAPDNPIDPTTITNPVLYGMLLHSCVTNPALRYILPVLLKRGPNFVENDHSKAQTVGQAPPAPPPPPQPQTSSQTRPANPPTSAQAPLMRSLLSREVLNNQLRQPTLPPIFPFLKSLPLTRAHITQTQMNAATSAFNATNNRFRCPDSQIATQFASLQPAPAVQKSSKPKPAPKRRIALTEYQAKVTDFMQNLRNPKGSLESESSSDDEDELMIEKILAAKPPPPPERLPIHRILDDADSDITTHDVMLVLKSNNHDEDRLPHVKTHINFENDHTNNSDEFTKDVEYLKNVVSRMQCTGMDVGAQTFIGLIKPPMIVKEFAVLTAQRSSNSPSSRVPSPPVAKKRPRPIEPVEKEDGEISDDDDDDDDSCEQVKSQVSDSATTNLNNNFDSTIQPSDLPIYNSLD